MIFEREKMINFEIEKQVVIKGVKIGTGRSEGHPSVFLLGFPHCQRCFQEVIPKSSL